MGDLASQVSLFIFFKIVVYQTIVSYTTFYNIDSKNILSYNSAIDNFDYFQNMLKIGHRGARGYAPENTLKSFQKAIELGVDAIELDVQICKSGELVVIHDDAVDRTTNGSGLVKKLKLKDLKKLDAGEGERIPTLEEVFDLVNRQVKINIELKGPKTAKPVMELIDEYVKTKRWSEDDFIVSSFIRREIKEARVLSPLIQIGVLISKPRLIDRWSFRFAQKICASFIGPGKKFITKRFVRNAHKHGLRIFVWTGNDLKNINSYAKDITKLKRFDIDGIFSDYPDRLNG